MYNKHNQQRELWVLPSGRDSGPSCSLSGMEASLFTQGEEDKSYVVGPLGTQGFGFGSLGQFREFAVCGCF